MDSDPKSLNLIQSDSKNHIETLSIDYNLVPDFYNEVQNLTSVKDTHGGLSNIVLSSKKKELNSKIMKYLQGYNIETHENYYDK